MTATTAPASAILLLGDPQINHSQGAALKAQGLAADVIANVAVRPPLLNILAPFALERLVSAPSTPTAPVALVLGDAANIACTSELQTFSEAMSRGLSHQQGAARFWLMAHGNHDTYMGGNLIRERHEAIDICLNRAWTGFAGTNYRQVPCVLSNVKNCGDSEDYAWWTGEESYEAAYEGGLTPIVATNSTCPTPEDGYDRTSWSAVCGSPDMQSQPVNKAVWLTWYLEHLRSLGGTSSPVSRTGDVVSFTTSSTAGSALASIGFEATGQWQVPQAGEPFDVYHSFIVQSFFVDAALVVVIDTSDAPTGQRLGAGWRGGTAGTNSGVSNEQLAKLDYHLSRARSRVVVAGHFPFAELDDDVRVSILAKARVGNMGRGVQLEYWSAHTHAPTSIGQNGGVRELNVGSTTDWPMEVAVRHMSYPLSHPNGVSVYTLGTSTDANRITALLGSSLTRTALTPSSPLCQATFERYKSKRGIFAPDRVQACNHWIDAGRILDTLWEVTHAEPAGWPVHGWKQTFHKECSVAELYQAALALAGTQRQIADLLSVNPTAQAAAMCLVRAASISEGIQSFRMKPLDN